MNDVPIQRTVKFTVCRLNNENTVKPFNPTFKNTNIVVHPEHRHI